MKMGITVPSFHMGEWEHGEVFSPYCHQRNSRDVFPRRENMLFLSCFALIVCWLSVAGNFWLVEASGSSIGLGVRSGNDMNSCLEYEENTRTFFMSCSFNWAQHYDEDDYILLEKNEIFNGNNYNISLTGITNWNGAFKISSTSVTALNDGTPKVMYLHMQGGETSVDGGFIVQPKQKNFIVDSCSSSGVIQGIGSNPDGPNSRGGGGICGQECSGEILIMNSYSTGSINDYAGGIAGHKVGINSGNVTISHCYSTGDIVGRSSGGICGRWCGIQAGHVNIRNCHSSGDIRGTYSGGLCGSSAGYNNGEVLITRSHSTGRITGPGGPGGICGSSPGRRGRVEIFQCYSVGEISSSRGGGTTGLDTGRSNGFVLITDSYARGNITGSNAGGICGVRTGRRGGTVIIKNVYASGHVKYTSAGSIIGGTDIVFDNDEYADEIDVQSSVYNGADSVSIIGDDDPFGIVTVSGNSGNLTDIIGKVYCNGDNNECWDVETVWKAVPDKLPILRFQILSSPSPQPTEPPISSPSFTSPQPTRGRTGPIQLPAQYPQRTVIIPGD
eukprot:gb/GECG01014525.1/.p1 GENE.gb/GECG01014525.1/~~gb/GECG01014525.1/.p1  ORF type:complete len:557 (+),score=47.65 gb/GECG01014525.1/:1-1671(+)